MGKTRCIGRILFGILLGSLIVGATIIGAAQAIDWARVLKETMPNTDKFTQLSDLNKYKARELTRAIFPAYKDGNQVGVVFYAAPYGYQSNLHTLTALDMKGTVVKVNVFSHNETPSYVVPLDNGSYLRQFEGVTLLDRLSFLIGARPTKRGEIQSIVDATATAKPIALAVSEARKLFVEIYGAR
ncbi:MAG: FMN-binding protein [Bacteroidota bacterium]